MVEVHPGPVVTRFAIQLAPGVKVNKVTNLAKDLARALSVISVRVVEEAQRLHGVRKTESGKGRSEG